MKKVLLTVLSMVLALLVFAGCSAARTATVNIKDEAENFNLYRKLTAINLRTDKVLFEIEGFFNYENEADGDLSIVMEVADERYSRHVVHITEGTTFVVEQIEAAEVSPYAFRIRIFATYPQIVAGQD